MTEHDEILEACPDAESLAAVADGFLDDPAIEVHAAACPLCGPALAAARVPAPRTSGRARIVKLTHARPSRTPFAPIAAAAALLVTGVLAVFLLRGSSPAGAPPEPQVARAPQPPDLRLPAAAPADGKNLRVSPQQIPNSKSDRNPAPQADLAVPSPADAAPAPVAPPLEAPEAPGAAQEPAGARPEASSPSESEVAGGTTEPRPGAPAGLAAPDPRRGYALAAITGPLEVRRGPAGEWQPVAAADLFLSLGDALRVTGRKQTGRFTISGATISLASGAVLSTAQGLTVDAGDVEVDAANRAEVRLRTEFAEVWTIGGRFEVERKGDFAKVSSRRGAVHVEAQGKRVTIAARQWTDVLAGEAPRPPYGKR